LAKYSAQYYLQNDDKQSRKNWNAAISLQILSSKMNLHVYLKLYLFTIFLTSVTPVALQYTTRAFGRILQSWDTEYQTGRLTAGANKWPNEQTDID